MNVLPEGFPRESDYRVVVQSDLFRLLEKFSTQFLERNRLVLRRYARKWVADPLHHWSRQWEYPFVYTRVANIVEEEIAPKVLDAGSGITFFPYFLGERFEKANIFCCDYDESLKAIYHRINESEPKQVEFTVADLRSLPYPDNLFHLVYSISVLEHTGDYQRIACELHRVLRPGGELIITMDISLDGSPGISLEEGERLFQVFAKYFKVSNNLVREFYSVAKQPGIFTTRLAQSIDQRLIPWYLPWILHRYKMLLATFRLPPWPPLLSVFCFTAKKAVCSSR